MAPTPPEVDKAATLKDVAELAKVSVSTASRILDDRGAPSQSPNADRVRQAADQLGYRRNAAAAGLRRGATSTIGVLVPKISDTVMGLMFEAIEKAGRTRGMTAVVATCGDDPTQEALSVEGLLERNVDGLVLATARYDDELPASLRERHIPHVLVLRTDNESDASIGDDVTGGYLATRHLLDLGHTRIATITGPSFTSTARNRTKGAQQALAEYEVEEKPGFIIHASTYGVDDGLTCAETLLSLPENERPTAIFAANDDLAIGVMSAAYRMGFTPGENLAIVGYNDIPLAKRLPVPLSSVQIPYDAIAGGVFELLAEPTDITKPRIAKFMPTLIPRASSGRPLR